jgi:hypothetical protein
MLEINNFQSKLKHKKVVYTAIFGNKDNVPIIDIIPNDWDFVCFTDNNKLSSNLWKIVYTEGNNVDPTRSARYIKHQPHTLFPNHDISIWIDANIHLLCDINSLLYTINMYDFVGFQHPEKVEGIYHEGDRCIKFKKDDPEIIKKQLKKYRDESFPEKCDILATWILVRKHNLKHVIDFDNNWFKEIENGSKRDQLSFPYVAKKLNLKYGKIKCDKSFTVWDMPGIFKRNRHKK